MIVRARASNGICGGRNRSTAVKYTTWLVAIALVTHGAAAETIDKKNQDSPEHVRVGAIAGVGFPHPLTVEALVKIDRIVAIGAEYGFTPDINISGVTASMWSASGDVRVFRCAARSSSARARRRAATPRREVVRVLASDHSANVLREPAHRLLVDVEERVHLRHRRRRAAPVTYSVTGTSTAMSIPQLTNAASLIGGTVLPTVDLLKIGFML